MDFGSLLENSVVLLFWAGILVFIWWMWKSGTARVLFQSTSIAFDMLRLHKLRAFLTMLGVIIGVMSVTLIVMVSNGFQSFLTSEFSKVGSDIIMVLFDPGRRRLKTTVEGLTIDDVKYLRDQVPSIDLASPIMQLPAQDITAGDKKVDKPKFYATDEVYLELYRVVMAQGRPLKPEDIRNRANVACIGPEIAERLFPEGKPLGKLIQCKGITLEVVGVFEKLDIMGSTNAKDIVIPLTTAQDKWIGGKTVMFISVRPKPGVKVADTVESIWQAMMRKSGNKPMYRVESMESMLGVMTGILGGAGVVLAGIAALSLFVGGIGIMNIMLVSVTERTREIGLRKAVGATRNVVLIQFLVEAAALSMVGGLIGMGAAWILGQGVTVLSASFNVPSKAGLQMSFPMNAAIVSTLFSAGIGVIFGLYPAFSAAKLNPIEALRKE
jgi:putative ABC transport system permease protein